MKLKIKSPSYAQGLPTSCTKRAREKEMEGSFFIVVRAEDTIVIVILKLMSRSSKYVPDIQSIHEKEPSEDFNLICTFGVLDPNKRSRAGGEGLTFLYGRW
jgi:hypothetical protein